MSKTCIIIPCKDNNIYFWRDKNSNLFFRICDPNIINNAMRNFKVSQIIDEPLHKLYFCEYNEKYFNTFTSISIDNIDYFLNNNTFNTKTKLILQKYISKNI